MPGREKIPVTEINLKDSVHSFMLFGGRRELDGRNLQQRLVITLANKRPRLIRLSLLIDRRAAVDAIADVHVGTLTPARQMAAPSFCILPRDRCLSVRSLGITASDNYPERLQHINTGTHLQLGGVW